MAQDIQVYTTMALDPAVTSKEYSDFNGITIVGNDANDTWYILEADAYKAEPDAVVQRIVHYAQQYRPSLISCEGIAAQRLYLGLIRTALLAVDLRIPIKMYSYSTRYSKRLRIESLQPRFKQGKVIIRAGLTDLITQLKTYPEVEHDDLLDSLAQHIPISRPFNPKFFQITSFEDDVYQEEDDDYSEEGNNTLTGTWLGKGTTRYGLSKTSDTSGTDSFFRHRVHESEERLRISASNRVQVFRREGTNGPVDWQIHGEELPSKGKEPSP